MVVVGGGPCLHVRRLHRLQLPLLHVPQRPMLAVHGGDEHVRLLRLLPQQPDKLLVPSGQQGTDGSNSALLALDDLRAVGRRLGDARRQLLRRGDALQVAQTRSGNPVAA